MKDPVTKRKTHTLARTRARTRMHARTCTHARTHARTHIHTPPPPPHTHTHTHTRPRVCSFALGQTLDLSDVFSNGAAREGPRQHFGRVESSREKVMILERCRGRRLLLKTYRPALSYVPVDLSAPSNVSRAEEPPTLVIVFRRLK